MTVPAPVTPPRSSEARRDALVRLLTHTEDQLARAEPHERRHLARELRRIRWFVEHQDDLAAGPHYFAWRGGRNVPLALLGTGIPMVWAIAQSGEPLVKAVLLSALTVPLAAGAVVGVLYLGWHAHTRRVEKYVERGEQLLRIDQQSKRP